MMKELLVYDKDELFYGRTEIFLNLNMSECV